jgi:hypothetical protein
MSDRYSEGGRVRGKCSVCGTEEVHTYVGKGKHKSKHFLKPFYFRVFDKVNWFRGDDEYAGTICKDCLKAGKINQAHKQTPPQPTPLKDKS